MLHLKIYWLKQVSHWLKQLFLLLNVRLYRLNDASHFQILFEVAWKYFKKCERDRGGYFYALYGESLKYVYICSRVWYHLTGLECTLDILGCFTLTHSRTHARIHAHRRTGCADIAPSTSPHLHFMNGLFKFVAFIVVTELFVFMF